MRPRAPRRVSAPTTTSAPTRPRPGGRSRPPVAAAVPGVVSLSLAVLSAATVALSAAMVAPLPAGAQEADYENLDRFEEECGSVEDEDEQAEEEDDHSRLSDECRPLAEIPERPRPLLEVGEPFLGTGTLGSGFEIPGGAVWQPAFLAFGTLRTAVQGLSTSEQDPLAEAVGRMDLFGNLYLTQTERLVVGIRPLDRDGSFTRFTLTDPAGPGQTEEGEFTSELNGALQRLFFEGDLSSLIPAIDPNDTRGLDVYFSVGRQPLSFQDGLLLSEDQMDMVGLTKANMKVGSAVNTRLTFVYGWGEVSRHAVGAPAEHESSSLFGLFSEIDLRSTTLELDAAYVTGDDVTGDGIHAGIADIRRIGHFNNTLRVLASFPVGEETAYNRRGVLIHDQFSWTPYGSHDFWYVGGFAGIGEFRSAARAPSIGGPAAQTGVLFEGPGIGRVGAAIGSRSDDAAGAALGHQKFFSDSRQQLLLEAGGRTSIDSQVDRTLLGGGARYQAAMGRRWVFVAEGTAGYDIDAETTTTGGRVELLLKF